MRIALLLLAQTWLRGSWNSTVYHRSRPHIEDTDLAQPACDVKQNQPAESVSPPFLVSRSGKGSWLER